MQIFSKYHVVTLHGLVHYSATVCTNYIYFSSTCQVCYVSEPNGPAIWFQNSWVNKESPPTCPVSRRRNGIFTDEPARLYGAKIGRRGFFFRASSGGRLEPATTPSDKAGWSLHHHRPADRQRRFDPGVTVNDTLCLCEKPCQGVWAAISPVVRPRGHVNDVKPWMNKLERTLRQPTDSLKTLSYLSLATADTILWYRIQNLTKILQVRRDFGHDEAERSLKIGLLVWLLRPDGARLHKRSCGGQGTGPPASLRIGTTGGKQTR